MARAGKLDLVVTYKKETLLNLGLLHKLQPMLPKTAQQLFNENGLEKPTQNLFNHITYYLVSIIDPQVHASLPWPLFDSKGERAYRSELSGFVAKSAAKGLLTPVMSSYLVNPSCFKVTVLLFQISLWAVKRMLATRLTDNKKVLYDNITEKYNNLQGKCFIEHVRGYNYENNLFEKLQNYLFKKQHKERIAEMLRRKITEGEGKLSMLKCQPYIDELVDGFISKNELDDYFKSEILEMKNVNMPSKIFDNWLMETDRKLDIIEANWDNKVMGYLEKCTCMQRLTEAIVHRHTGQTERSSYTIEYDPKNDMIHTDELQSQVNSEQKYILKNFQNDGRLNFPNLIRAFLISICFILSNNEVDDTIYSFNEHMDYYGKNFREALSALRMLLERVSNAENKLQELPVAVNVSHVSMDDYFKIPELPNLSDLKMNLGQYHVMLDTFTPLNVSKHQFNLYKRASQFVKPKPRSIIPLFQAPRDDFLKTLISSRVSTYDHTISSCNLSVISNTKVNETIAECSSGFTRQQIVRLLSNKKSSSKKYKYKRDQQDLKSKKANLFNESIVSSHSNSLFRSYSSPNLFENVERQSYTGTRGRKLSIMPEDSPLLEVSGIACLDNISNSPVGLESVVGSEGELSLPVKKDVTCVGTNRMHNDFNENLGISPIPEVPRIVVTFVETESCTLETETPKSNKALIKKTSSLEKIIKRFKKVRESVIPSKDTAKDSQLQNQPIVEEIENLDMCSANRNLLPDLLNSSCSNYWDINFDDEYQRRQPRESLGTALGVDNTFLDQYDLSD